MIVRATSHQVAATTVGGSSNVQRKLGGVPAGAGDPGVLLLLPASAPRFEPGVPCGGAGDRPEVPVAGGGGATLELLVVADCGSEDPMEAGDDEVDVDGAALALASTFPAVAFFCIVAMTMRTTPAAPTSPITTAITRSRLRDVAGCTSPVGAGRAIAVGVEGNGPVFENATVPDGGREAAAAAIAASSAPGRELIGMVCFALIIGALVPEPDAR